MNGLQLITLLDRKWEDIEKEYIPSKLGNIFEKTFVLHFYYNGYTIFIGNIDKPAKMKKITNLRFYLENLKVFGTDGGPCDILLEKNGNKYYCSAKFSFDDTNKYLDKFDIEKIRAIVPNAYVYLLVRDKSILREIIRKNKGISTKKNLEIFDLSDIDFKFLRECLKNIDTDLPLLKLRLHQEYISDSIIKSRETKFLIGAKPRSGKTFIDGGIISKFYKLHKKINVLFITTLPTETIDQYIDMFINYRDFDGIHIMDFRRKISKSKKSNIFIVSKQHLDYNNYEFPHLDFVFFDENHYGGTTFKSIDHLLQHNCDKIIFTTATYIKTVHCYIIPKECCYFWGIEEEKLCKDRDILKLQQIMDRKVRDRDLEIYDRMPILCYEGCNFIRGELSKIKSMKEGFSMNTLFSCKNGNFQYEKDVESFLTLIKNRIYPNIRKLSAEKNNRALLSNTHFSSQLWFIPHGSTDVLIKDITKNLEVSIKNILKNYDVMSIHSKIKNVKSEIMIREREARDNGKLGLIILTGRMLAQGITLPNVDLVFLLNDIQSSDLVIQMIYRCMTEGKSKTLGIVVDLNPLRKINTILNLVPNGKGDEEKIKYIIDYQLICVDEMDKIIEKSKTNEMIINDIINEYRKYPNFRLEIHLRKLYDIEFEFDKRDTKFLQSLVSLKSKSIKITHLESDRISSGKIIENNREKKQIGISFAELLEYVCPLLIFLCLKEVFHIKNNYLESLLKLIEDEYSEPFNEQLKIWWNRSDPTQILKMLKKINNDNIKNNLNNIMESVINQIKEDIDNPKLLLEYINKMLAPKKVETRLYGEVFTPLFIIDEMLDTLDEHHLKIHNRSIFSEKDYRWFDPAVGIGNFFVCLYLRLMKHIPIKDEGERKKHILENMLYASELNKKNCEIYRGIFQNSEYFLNLYEGDTLKLDIKKEWNLDKFDVVIGNPPYNTEQTHNKVMIALYPTFIFKFIDLTRYLMFIIPSKWFGGGGNGCREMLKLKDRNNISLIKHFNNSSDIFGRKVEIKGGIMYFLKDENYSGNCNINGYKIILKNTESIQGIEYKSIIKKLEDYPKITDIYHSQNYFNIKTNDKRLINFYEDYDKNKYYVCYVSKQKGFKKLIEIQNVKREIYWNILTPDASYKENSGFGNIFISNSNEVFSETYISFKVKNEKEAKSLESFLKSRFANFLLSLRKVSQHIPSESCKYIPLPPLDRTWTDREIYKYYKLNDEEIEQIKNANIVGYKE